MTSLNGKTIFLTGATRGIGRALALRLAGEQARLALCGRDADALREVEAEVSKSATASQFCDTFDLADEPAIIAFYGEARKQLGVPDVLINNAGFNARKAPLIDVTTEEFDTNLAVNIRAPFILMREAYRDMKERGEGHIVNILSTVCHSSNETMGVYTAAKAGLQALTNVFRKEARPFGIRVTSVYPGGVDTSFRANVREDYMRPESVAEAVTSLLTMPEDLVMHDMTFRPMVESNF